MTSGGYRQPNPAKQGMYPNRSDMRKTQPVRTATGQEYGVAGQQAAAQHAIPLANDNPLAQAQQPGQAVAAPALSAPMPAPGNGLQGPTARPGEPITTGLPIGAGAGPEAMAHVPTDDEIDIEQYRHILPTLELLATQPNTSASTRNFIRRIRGALPPQPQ